MRVVRVPPEHVRLEVAAGEVEEEQAVLVVVDGVVQQREPLLEHHAGLPGILVVGEDAVLPGRVVLLKAGGGERPQPSRDVLNERLRLGDLLRGGGRVHVDRRDVEPEVRRDFLEVEAADPVDALARQELGVERVKSIVVQRLHWPGLQDDLPALDLDHGRVGLAVAMDEELDGRSASAS